MLIVELQLNFYLGGQHRYLNVLTNLSFKFLQFRLVVVMVELGQGPFHEQQQPVQHTLQLVGALQQFLYSCFEILAKLLSMIG